ncbi:MAG: type II secretion system protein GspG [Phycisphaeraceae bacterium]|nr:type II secretion system protein GspG [Phycisphaeraceae bacterium]
MNVLLCTLALFYATANQVETSRTADTLLYIRTVPSGAQILLDGKPLGNSDGLFPVKPGMYKIVVDLEGHEPENQQISIRDGQITRIELELKQVPSATSWTCSMHPQIKQLKPGKCPICHMDLITLRKPQQPQTELNQPTKTVMLPDVDRRDGPTVLDLASGKLVENIARDGDASAYLRLGKGDLWQDGGYFGTVRDARAMLWDGQQFAPFKTIRPEGGSIGYGKLKLPCRLLITTAEKTHHDVSILWMDGKGSARVDYRYADPSIVRNNNTIFAYREAATDLRSIRTALEIYRLDTGQYPTTAQGLNALVSQPENMTSPAPWGGPYLKNDSLFLDPWGHPVQYEHIEKNGKPRVWSKGRDNKSGTSDDIPPNEVLAKRMKSGSHLSAIGKAMLIYANDHDDAYPPDLQALVNKADLHPRLLVSPLEPEDFVGPGYIYVVGQGTNMDPRNVIAYENPRHCQDGVNVLYLDSHVSWTKRDDFLQELEDTYERLGQHIPNIQFQNSDSAESRESDTPPGEVLANRMKSGANLSGIGKAMLIYANDHDDVFPPDLQALVSEAELLSKQLVSPSKPIGFVGPSYIYIAGQTALMDPRNVVAYENPGYCQDGVNVLYLDSHVFWQTPEKFMQALAATYKRLDRSIPNIQFENSDSPEVLDSDNMVFEMIIQDLDEGKGHEAIDLDNAKQYDLPPEHGNDQGGPNPPQQLASQVGVDLFADYARNRWALMTSGLTLKRYVPNKFWDRLGAAEVKCLSLYLRKPARALKFSTAVDFGSTSLIVAQRRR